MSPGIDAGARDRARSLVARIGELAGDGLGLMEVCGTHTVAIARSGLRGLLPPTVRLVSGPGCPVCVTPPTAIDRAIALSRLPEVTVLCFGDMLRAPGTLESLDQARAAGASVKTVYSPREGVDLARERPERRVVFFAVGFETTQPGIAAAVLAARREGLGNFLILPALKLVPPALRALLASGEVGLDGFILPGHVSVIIGLEPYGFLAGEFGKSGVVAGFEGEAILRAILRLAELKASGRPAIENGYGGVVRPEGNPTARRMVMEVFEPVDADWRGLGPIPRSGLGLRAAFADLDAGRIEVNLPPPSPRPPACRCGEVLKGLMEPEDCPLFGRACTPERPAGPCMVSSEGSCQARYRYGRTGL
jgi:hydrogenase expression/formation protein HypD